MSAEFTMPQMSDTMTEGTVVKWLKKEGDKVKQGEVIAEIETDKAVMESEAFDSGTIAAILVPEGQKAKVGGVLAVIATGSESVADIKKKYASGADKPPAAAPAPAEQASKAPSPAAPPASPAPATQPATAAAAPKPIKSTGTYNFDIIVIGGGPGGYA
ncbi:MAG TPA: biotin/lipoyl-containing protein, partial [Tepidisphaeraceae bacterium]